MVDFVLWRCFKSFARKECSIELRTINRLYKWLTYFYFLSLLFLLGDQIYDFFQYWIIKSIWRFGWWHIYKGKSSPSIYGKLQLLRYFRFSGHKLVHLDLGGAPPKLTYLLQVIPFENHSVLVCIFCRQNHLLSQILSFHLSLFFFAFAYFYIACHRCWFYLSFMAPRVFHISLGYRGRRNSFRLKLKIGLCISEVNLWSVQRKSISSKIKNFESTSNTASVLCSASKT